MTREKLQKLIPAITVAATLLFVFLLFVLIFQWVEIAQQEKRHNKLEDDITYWQEQVDKSTFDVAWYEGPGKYWLAIEKGWIDNPGE
ncbi:MAG: hypothetical protein IJ996_05120 [Clostridia bacterium]|nr:hypothetical protein [Clostridia bacterium]